MKDLKKKKKHMPISVDTEKAFNKAQRPFFFFFLSVFFFAVLRHEFRAYTLSHSTSPFCDGFFSR
jgi:hypothetical protein